jgi:ABC-type uncharacterized transport system YnjBCD ATPase subunit
MNNIKARIENGKLIIEMPLGTPRPSGSGKTTIIASTQGNIATDVIVDGKPLTIGVNAYIK